MFLCFIFFWKFHQKKKRVNMGNKLLRKNSNKTPNYMQQSIVKFIALSYRHCSTRFGHHNAHHREPVKLPSWPLVSVWMWRWKCSQRRLRTLPPPRSYGNQSPRRQFDGLPMMGVVMPEMCRAVSVRQSTYNFYIVIEVPDHVYVFYAYRLYFADKDIYMIRYFYHKIEIVRDFYY